MIECAKNGIAQIQWGGEGHIEKTMESLKLGNPFLLLYDM